MKKILYLISFLLCTQSYILPKCALQFSKDWYTENFEGMNFQNRYFAFFPKIKQNIYQILNLKKQILLDNHTLSKLIEIQNLAQPNAVQQNKNYKTKLINFLQSRLPISIKNALDKVFEIEKNILSQINVFGSGNPEDIKLENAIIFYECCMTYFK